MRTGQLSSVGNYRGARSELQSGQDPASKRQEREREKEKGGRGGGDAIFTPIYGEIPGRGTLTTSKQDLWKTPGDLRYHYLPRSGTVFRWTLMPAWFYSISFHRKKMLPLTHLTIHDPRVASSFIAINVSSVSCFSSVGLVLLLDWKERRKMGFSSLLFFSLCRGREFTGGEIWGSLWVTIYLFYRWRNTLWDWFDRISFYYYFLDALLM